MMHAGADEDFGAYRFQCRGCKGRDGAECCMTLRFGSRQQTDDKCFSQDFTRKDASVNAGATEGDMKLFIYSGTHWDREWFEYFRGFQYNLVGMTNDMLDGLENTEDYGVFHFDGQTIVLEDYLEIEPQNKERLRRLIEKGKLVIGPWYDMPDEFLVSGESLIKNLQKGKAVAKELFDAEVSKCGYVCDIFGHASQTPQIFAGMNIHHAVLGRGTNRHDLPSHFRWKSPDGTECVVCRLDDGAGYGDFVGFANGHPTDMPQEELDREIKAFFDPIIANAKIPVAVTFDATDFQMMRRDTAKYAEALRRAYPDAEVYHVSIDEVGKAQDEYIDQMPVKEGELADTTKLPGGYSHVITFTASSRYPLKKYNDRNQTMLEKWISPLYAFRKTNASYGFLNLANKFLIQNHPHDSICGCSIDQVHKDMMYRFDQTNEICRKLLGIYHGSLGGDLSADAVSEAAASDGNRVIRIYNPLPYRSRRTVEAEVQVDGGFPRYAEPFGYEGIPNFKVYDADGNEVPYGMIRVNGDTCRIAIETELTPMQVTEFKIVPQGMPTRYKKVLSRTADSAEGDRLAIRIHADGTILLTDKKTGEVYDGLLRPMDDGEIGDGWFHANPVNDRVISCTSANVEKIESNRLRTTFRVTQHMRLPCEMVFGSDIHRSENYRDFDLVHEITLCKHDRYLDVTTKVQNNCLDHRLKLRFPTGVSEGNYWSSQAFSFVPRACGEVPGTENWKEYGSVERNTAGIVLKRNGNRGLAFISAYGIHECGVWENGDMDITMFRAFRKTIGTPGEPGGELQEELSFRYRIMPLSEDETFADLAREQDFLQAGFLLNTAEGSGAKKYRPCVEFDNPNFIYSTANGLPEVGASELRLWNCSFETQTGSILLPAWAERAILTEIDGRQIRELEVKDGSIALELTPWKIATVRFM